MRNTDEHPVNCLVCGEPAVGVLPSSAPRASTGAADDTQHVHVAFCSRCVREGVLGKFVARAACGPIAIRDALLATEREAWKHSYCRVRARLDELAESDR
jgi:hypothetical protein